MIRPFASVALAYLAGVCLSPWVPVPTTAQFIIAFALLLLAFIWTTRRAALLWPLLMLTGWLNMSLRTDVLAPDDLRLAPGDRTAIVTLRGTLAETPHQKIEDVHDQEKWRTLAVVHAREIQENDRTYPVSGDVIVSTPDILDPNFFAGQPVQISGVISPPPGPLAEGLFDYQKYLATQGIFHQLKVTSTNDWQLLAPRLLKPPLTDRFLTWSKSTLALGLPQEDEPLRLLWAMTLGWRTAFTGDITDPFLRAGTFHMFAIDGLRIALLTYVIITFLSALRLSRAWCGMIAVPTIWFYTAATGWEPSAVRASVMTTIVLGGWILKRPGDLLNSLAFAAFIILVIDPRQLFAAGFQLSFFVVLIIALLMPPLNDLIHRRIQPDPFLARQLIPWWQEKMYAGLRHVAQFAALSFSAWIGSLPLSAYYFNLFSPVSTFANLLAVPLGALALVANLGALLCGHWFPFATILFNHAAWFLMVAMTWVSDAFTRLPGTYCYVPAPPFALVLAYYAIVIALLLSLTTTAKSGLAKFLTSKRFVVLTASLMFLIVAACYGAVSFGWHETKLTVLPLNGSQAIFATGPGGDYLIDCGNEKSVDFTLKPFLRAQGANHLSNLVLTEGSVQNAGGAPLLDQLFGLRAVYSSDVKSRSAPYREAIAPFDQPPARHHFVQLGDTLGPWHVLAPDTTSAPTRADDHALVLLGDFAGTKILLLSDLSRTGQSDLLSRTNDIRANIVIAGLPGKSEPLCDALLDAIHPRLIIITDTEEPASRRATEALQDRLAERNIPVIYTRNADAVTIVTRADGWSVRTMNGLDYRGTVSR